MKEGTTYYMILFIWNVQNKQIHTDRLLNRYEISFGCEEMFWNELVAMVEHLCKYTRILQKDEFYGIQIISQLRKIHLKQKMITNFAHLHNILDYYQKGS